MRSVAASRTRRAAWVTSGPMPSPGSTTRGGAAATLGPDYLHDRHDSRVRHTAQAWNLRNARQREVDLRSLSRFAGRLDRSAVRADDVFRDRQAESRAG